MFLGRKIPEYPHSNVKFSTAEGTQGPLRRAKFHVARGYLGIFGPKKHENLPKHFQSCKLFPPQGRIPRRFLVKFVRCMRVACLRNVLKFGAIWFINDNFVGKNCDWSFSPKLLEPPSSETTFRTQKVYRWTQKWYGHALSSCQVWWRSAAAQRRDRKKLVFFVCLFLFVCHIYGLCISGLIGCGGIFFYPPPKWSK